MCKLMIFWHEEVSVFFVCSCYCNFQIDRACLEFAYGMAKSVF